MRQPWAAPCSYPSSPSSSHASRSLHVQAYIPPEANRIDSVTHPAPAVMTSPASIPSLNFVRLSGACTSPSAKAGGLTCRTPFTRSRQQAKRLIHRSSRAIAAADITWRPPRRACIHALQSPLRSLALRIGLLLRPAELGRHLLALHLSCRRARELVVMWITFGTLKSARCARQKRWDLFWRRGTLQQLPPHVLLRRTFTSGTPKQIASATAGCSPGWHRPRAAGSSRPPRLISSLRRPISVR